MKVTCPHCHATLKPKFAHNHIYGQSNEGGCKLRAAAQSKAAKEGTR